ncbi:NAD(P)-binding protein [Leifsonia sp. EB34]|uniref:NAD(P)-binding protein n=1 Tax=Leifsonia sp. EB34 TaxID=3156303 RepID=UPI0035180383
MASRILEADYLVVGAGASGMAFADALIAASDADVVLVDRRFAAGGHWNDSYPFIRLHQPSAYYGVNSLPLGTDAIDTTGLNAGMYERASGREICAYYERAMNERLLAFGRVRFFPQCDYLGRGEFVSRLTGDRFDVAVRRAVVDAAYLEPRVPATSPPAFGVDDEVRCAPVNELAHQEEPPDGYTIVGAGKTAADAILYLLQNDVPPTLIRWIKPREAWYLNRRFTQGGELLPTLFDGLALQAEACAEAGSQTELIDRLESTEQLLRVDPSVAPTMFRSPTASTAEIEQLRRVDEVVRLGRVRRIEADAIRLEQGSIPTTPGTLHVYAAAGGLNPAPEVPIFSQGRIRLQSMRIGLTPFNSALIGYVEATRSDIAVKNRLCPPNRQPNIPADWIRGTLIAWQADVLWAREHDIAQWMDAARTNISRGLREQRSRPELAGNVARYRAALEPAIANLHRLVELRSS